MRMLSILSIGGKWKRIANKQSKLVISAARRFTRLRVVLLVLVFHFPKELKEWTISRKDHLTIRPN